MEGLVDGSRWGASVLSIIKTPVDGPVTWQRSSSFAEAGSQWVVITSLMHGWEQEPVHKLAWTLDACLKDRVIDERRLRELNHFLSTFDRQQAQLAAAGR